MMKFGTSSDVQRRSAKQNQQLVVPEASATGAIRKVRACSHACQRDDAPCRAAVFEKTVACSALMHKCTIDNCGRRFILRGK
eukprot:5365854-Pleurochrysis_carterae.AAC.3